MEHTTDIGASARTAERAALAASLAGDLDAVLASMATVERIISSAVGVTAETAAELERAKLGTLRWLAATAG